MKFVLVSQAESVDGLNGSGLSDTGRLQAQAVAASFGASPSLIYCGPTAAATETAAIITAARELDDPLTRPELEAPQEAAFETAQEAMWGIIEAAKTELDATATLVLVTQEANVRLLVCRALSMPLAVMQSFAIEPGSMTTIEWRTQPRERLLLASLNEVCHLEKPS